MSDRPETPLLDTVHWPADIRALDKTQLPQLADELRAEMISAVSQSGGHLGSGLGVVELWAAPNGSYSLSLRRVKPLRPPPWRNVRIRSRRPVTILCG